MEDEDVVELTDESEVDQSNEEDISDGEDLRTDLQNSLEELDFKGSYALSHTFQESQNPWLHVDGVGLVGLPLSERDARHIIATANQAPYGHGTQTVVNSSVRHTWEIEPRQFMLKNPKWNKFMNRTALKVVCDGLGVESSTASLRCELYELLLYEPGSHFRPHQDTQKSPGMFATIIVVLPSQFSGGEVTVCHSQKRMVFDLAPNSMLTSVLSWYTDVVHGVSPVTSGYRLALSYNLIHTSPDVLPTLPSNENTIQDLRQILRKWKHGRYEEPSQQNMVAYLLAHQYSSANLSHGFTSLKGEDAHMISNLRTVAAEEGFCLYLGSLEYWVSGCLEPGDRYNPWKRRRRYYSDDNSDEGGSECPTMGDIMDSNLTVSNVVDLYGNAALNSETKEMYLDDTCLIPQDPFEDVDPDRREVDPYMGNSAGTVDHWYHCTVLILLRGKDRRRLMVVAGDVQSCVAELEKLDPANLTPDDRDLASMTIDLLSTQSHSYSAYSHDATADMLDIAVAWDDLPMWKRIAEKVQYLKKAIDDARYVDALEQFDFEAFKPNLQMALKKRAGIKDKLIFLDAISTGPGQIDPLISDWCSDYKFKVLESTCPLGSNDIPLILDIAETDGVSKTMKCILPLLKQQNFKAPLWIALIESLIERQKTARPRSPEWKMYARKCLDIAASSWAAQNAGGTVQGPTPTYSSTSWILRPNLEVTQDARVGIAVELIELCLSLDRMATSSTILDSLTKVGGDSKKRYQMLFQPCIEELQRILPAYQLTISTPPFCEFAQHILGLYLRDVLGPKETFAKPNIRKLGCGCLECKELDRFLVSPRSIHNFQCIQAIRAHLEGRLRRAGDLVTFHTLRSGSPHTLVVRKTPDVAAACAWAGRQSAAREFLGSFGDDDAIWSLMGDYTTNIVKALNGEQPFAWSSNYLTRARAAANQQPSSSASSSQTVAGASQIPPSSQTGTKRKNLE